MGEADVTILCATYNGRDVVQLTLASLASTARPARILIADNGSTDGTLELLRRVPFIELTTFPERLAQMAARAPWAKPPEEAQARLHGPTLDWLAERVSTPFFLTLDSDVELLAPGWLAELVAFAEREALDAVGEHDPGIGEYYRPRIQPHVALLRTRSFARLRTGFAGMTTIADPEVAKRWLAFPARVALSPEEAERFPGARYYSVGARLLERMQETGARFAPTPDAIRAQYQHIGHMSWGAEAGATEIAGAVKAEHARREEHVRQRLLRYRDPAELPDPRAPRPARAPFQGPGA